MSQSCDILRIRSPAKLSAMLQYCDDENFPTHYECSKIHLTGYDVVYVGFDKENKKLCGYVHVNIFAHFYELNSIASRSGKDTQYKGNMKLLFDAIVSDAQDKDFLTIDASTPDGLKFYTRYGFKLIGRTGRLVLPIKRLPTVTELRKLDIFYKMSTPWLLRLWFKKSQDTSQYQHKVYGTYEDQEGYENPISDISVLLDTTDVIMYPDWMYASSKKHRPDIPSCEKKTKKCFKSLKRMIGI